MTNSDIVEAINRLIDAVNILTKRIEEKPNLEDIEKIKLDIVSNLGDNNDKMAEFTQGLVDFFTMSLDKNNESNRLILGTIRSSIKLIEHYAKYIDIKEDEGDEEWLSKE